MDKLAEERFRTRIKDVREKLEEWRSAKALEQAMKDCSKELDSVLYELFCKISSYNHLCFRETFRKQTNRALSESEKNDINDEKLELLKEIKQLQERASQYVKELCDLLESEIVISKETASFLNGNISDSIQNYNQATLRMCKYDLSEDSDVSEKFNVLAEQFVALDGNIKLYNKKQLDNLDFELLDLKSALEMGIKNSMSLSSTLSNLLKRIKNQEKG